MNPFQQLAMNMINQNPNIQNNPMAKEMLNVISSGDAQRGEAMANNLCQSMGKSKEEVLQQASQFFGLKL